MKKIIIASGLILLFCGLQVNSACQLTEIMNGKSACTIGLQGGQNQTIKDKLIPNNLDQMANPSRNTSKEFRSQPHTMPETINTKTQYNDPERLEGNTPYNAACQFGVCMPGESSNSQNGR
ncbi:hypothetical protein HDR58_10815 [bacterium]|nr:hypothetical protein [bacterium]